jgi:hypothetical protein
MGNADESHLLFISPRQFISMKHSIKTKKVNQRGHPCKDHKIAQIKAAKVAVATVDAVTVETVVVAVVGADKASRIETAQKIEMFSIKQEVEGAGVVDEF